MTPAADRPVLTTEHAAHLACDSPTLIIDLAIPRNVAPTLAELQPVTVIDLDGLKRTPTPGTDLARVNSLARQSLDEHEELYHRLIQTLQGIE